MREYPLEVFIGGEFFRYEKILKDDFFSVNVLYRNNEGVRYVLKQSDFRFLFGFLLRPLAMFFSRREYRIYRIAADIEGIPELGPRYGFRGYFHRFIEGKTLHEVSQTGETLPDDFFEGLKRIINELHRKRIFYLDLNKLGNILLGADGLPYLIDFQVSMHFRARRGLLGKIHDYLFENLIREDIYHICKHKKRFLPHLVTEEEQEMARRTKFNEWYDRIWGTPYRRVKRLIYPSGSNDIIWYKWKRMSKKEREKTMP